MNAKFKCCKCGYKYETNPGPTQCWKCGNLYVEWINYEEWRKWAEDQGIYDYQLTLAEKAAKKLGFELRKLPDDWTQILFKR